MFSAGTRKNTTSLRFNINLTFDTKQIKLVSEESNHFVVITNESQWGEAQGKLCKTDIFKGSEETTWARFTNVFNMHFVLSTRQSPVFNNEEFRALSQDDFSYLHGKWFDNKQMVTTAQFDKFWNWFCKTVHLLRYQKKIVGGLWRSGLLYGFITKEGVNKALGPET